MVFIINTFGRKRICYLVSFKASIEGVCAYTLHINSGPTVNFYNTSRKGFCNMLKNVYIF